jgi:DNA invertase Pin-like site-specific DNA recombinase
MGRAREQGWILVALELGIDLGTPTGELLANIMVSVRQWERRVIGQRTKDGLAATRSNDVRLGGPVLISADVAEGIHAERAAGRTLGKITDGLTADGVATSRGKAWHASTVRAVLQRAV